MNIGVYGKDSGLLKEKTLKKNIIFAFILFLVCFFSVALTIKGIGITWDEPEGYFYGVDLIIKWGKECFSSLKRGEIKKCISEEFTDRYWMPPTEKTARMEYPNNHPPFSRYGQTLFWLLCHNFLDETTCYRLSSAFLFSLLVALLCFLISQNYGQMAGLYAGLSLIFIPRLFGHAHIAASDIPITVMWFLTVYLFWKALESKKYILPFAIAFGLAIITKFQAILIPFPLIVYSLLYERKNSRKLITICMVTVVVAPVVAILTNPIWWHHPIERIIHNYFILGINHSKHNPLYKYYFGRFYLYTKPWHMPIVMILITTPLTLLLTFFIGTVYIIKNKFKDRLLVFFMINTLFLLAIFMLPMANSYDGVRHFLVLFPFCGGIGGAGFKWISDLFFGWLKKIKEMHRITCLPQKISLMLFILLLSPAMLDTFLIHPYELSYYNCLIGGIKGAFISGMETTYWFDAVNTDFINYLNKNLPLNAKISIYPSNPSHFIYLQKSGAIRSDFIFTQDDSDYLILLTRQSLFSLDIWKIFLRHRPVYSIKIDEVPIISIYKLERPR